MNAKGFLATPLLVIIALLVNASSVLALKRIAVATSPQQQVMAADMIVEGTVTDLEPEVFKAPAADGSGEYPHMIAIIRIDKVLYGKEGLTHLRVGFVPTVDPNGVIEDEFAQKAFRRDGFYSGRMTQLRLGQSGCFFLNQHPKGDFLVPPAFSQPLLKNHSTYDEDLRMVEKVLAIRRDPIGSLKAKESMDRQLAAALLASAYRSPVIITGKSRTELVSAEESELILRGLAEMTWGNNDFDMNGFLSIQYIFYQLGASEKDGWKQPVIKETDDHNAVMADAVKKWLKESAGKYRIQRVIPEKPTSPQN